MFDIFQYAPGGELVTELAIVLCEIPGGVLCYVEIIKNFADEWFDGEHLLSRNSWMKLQKKTLSGFA